MTNDESGGGNGDGASGGDGGADRPAFVPWNGWREREPAEMARRAREFYEEMDRRRSVRAFSDRPVPRSIIEDCIRTAGTAPSGAHRQPWRFVAVSDPDLKRRIREAAEEEERAFYEGRAPDEWLEALAPLGTDARKPYLETAPWLLAAFAVSWGRDGSGGKVKHYYVQESVGIAVGLLLAAIHHAGLAALTHTPSPMTFLQRILERPENERAFLLLPVGYPVPGVRVPDLSRKRLTEIAEFR